jgi:hypothetical protein
LRPARLPESAPESDFEPEVSKEPGLVPVILWVAIAPTAPAPVLPAAESWKADVRVEKAVPSDEENKPELAVSIERVLVTSVVLENETLIVGVTVGGVESEALGESLLLESTDDVEIAVGFAARLTGLDFAEDVKKEPDGSGEGGGDESGA